MSNTPTSWQTFKEILGGLFLGPLYKKSRLSFGTWIGVWISILIAITIGFGIGTILNGIGHFLHNISLIVEKAAN